jgi:hypothetical protein
MLNMIDNLNMRLAKSVRSSDTTVTIVPQDALQLNQLAVGEHIYLTFRQGGTYEIMKYTHTAPITGNAPVAIAVQRDSNGTGAKNFATGMCIKAEWNRLQMLEYLEHHLACPV